MKILAPLVLAVAASMSIAVAATVSRPVALPSKKCCDDCTVARYRPAGVPPTEASLVHGAAALEGALLLSALGLVLLSNRNPRPPAESPQPAAPLRA